MKGILAALAVALSMAPGANGKVGVSKEPSVESPRSQIEGILRRLERLEAGAEEDRGDAPEPSAYAWVRRLRVSGNADVGYLHGENNARSPNGSFLVENARLFFDLDLGPFEEPSLRRVARGGGLLLEWDLMREGELKNQVGSLYLELNSLFDQPWLNLRVGRAPIPFGIEYLRFHQARPENPLFSYSVTSPYHWDEGLSLYGAFGNTRFRYVASVMDGDKELGANSAADPAVALRLSYLPVLWAEVSLSGFRSGRLRGRGGPAGAAIEFAGIHPYPFGAGSDVPNFVDGVALPDDPSFDVDDTLAWEVDLVLRSNPWGRAWFSYGAYEVQSGSSQYDRDLQYWAAEGELELAQVADALGGREFSDRLSPWYAGLRYSGVGTLDDDEGYLLGFMNEGQELGFNTKRVQALSAGLGYRIGRSLRVKLEYSHFVVDLVRGVPAALRSDARSRDYLGVFLSAGF